jgi:hypothetical protein
MGGLFVSRKIATSLINALLEAIDLMTEEDVGSISLQKSLIGRAINHLSPAEPARINLAPKIAQCTTFKEFLLLWTRYKSSKQVIVDNLSAEGYIVTPKSYLLSAGSANADKNLKTKKEQIQYAELSAPNLSNTTGHIKLDPKYTMCNGYGRQEYDKNQEAEHSYSNCFLRHHPNWNTDPLVKWKDSSSGGAFAALTPLTRRMALRGIFLIKVTYLALIAITLFL